MKLKLILNKSNKSATIQLPKKTFEKSIRQKIDKSKWAFIKFEGFE